MRALLVFALLIAAGAAEARNVRETHFENPSQPSDRCFDRVYSRDHMRKHPQQTVTRLTVILSETPGPRGGAVLDLFAELKNGMGGQSNFAKVICAPLGSVLDCTPADGSAGGVTVQAAKGGALLVSLKWQGLIFDNPEGGMWVQGDAGDDRQFLVPNVAPEACY
ncbi:hypothetical protein GEU84_002430 [Fertoebacter nigrum]|uniref:Uncharacterized protein n=1 Tax=Fertoeibacter niger TaxID=2656921 RepID=A0A8X8GWM6_9RHOB|nr:hypothetical protein [Fertoeibacter niger]NUB43228.1 hypothetical protein [Fertoeibacter niger]